MDWGMLEGLLQCEPGNDLLHRFILILGGVASFATIVAALYKFVLWFFPPPPRHRRAARVLRAQGELQANQRRWLAAIELYDLSVRLNPRPAHVYYLRGLAHEQRGDRNRAIVDWKRSLDRRATDNPAEKKLALYEQLGRERRHPSYRLFVYAAGAVAMIVTVAGIVWY